MSDLEDRMKALDARIAARASHLESRFASRLGGDPPRGTGTHAKSGSRPESAEEEARSPSAPSSRAPGVRYGLFAGINDYSRPGLMKLDACNNDAKSLRDACVELGGWRPENTVVLPNATGDDFLSRLSSLSAKAVPGDLVLVLFSGHGGPRAGTPEDDFKFCFHDRDVTEKELRNALAKFKKGVKIVVVVDACKSHLAATDGLSGQGGLPDVGWIVASTSWQNSDDSFQTKKDNGFLTGALLEGWRRGGATGMAIQMRGGDRAAVPPPVSPGFVTFLDLAVFVAQSWRYWHPSHQQPQYVNERLLSSVRAGRIGQTAVAAMP